MTLRLVLDLSQLSDLESIHWMRSYDSAALRLGAVPPHTPPYSPRGT